MLVTHHQRASQHRSVNHPVLACQHSSVNHPVAACQILRVTHPSKACHLIEVTPCTITSHPIRDTQRVVAYHRGLVNRLMNMRPVPGVNPLHRVRHLLLDTHHRYARHNLRVNQSPVASRTGCVTQRVIASRYTLVTLNIEAGHAILDARHMAASHPILDTHDMSARQYHKANQCPQTRHDNSATRYQLASHSLVVIPVGQARPAHKVNHSLITCQSQRVNHLSIASRNAISCALPPGWAMGCACCMTSLSGHRPPAFFVLTNRRAIHKMPSPQPEQETQTYGLYTRRSQT